MIKKILGILIFVFVFGLSFLSAADLSRNMYVRENNNYGFSPYNNNFDIQVVKYGNLLTNQIGMTLRGIYLTDGTYFVWRYSDYLGGIAPYISYNYTGSDFYGHIFQSYIRGFPTYYALCDNFDNQNHIADYNLSGCNVFRLQSSSLQLIANFMSGVSNTDSFGFNYFKSYYPNNFEYNNGGALFCFSSNYYNRSICFGISKHTYLNDIIYPGFDNKTVNYSGYNQSNLPTSFTDLIGSDISMSPGNKGNNGDFSGSLEGPVESNINNVITGDYVYSDCTWNDILISLEAEGYNKYVCYGGIDNFELYNPDLSYNSIAGTGLSIAQIWANSSARAWDNFPDWFTFWEGLYLDSSDNNYNAMWSSYPAVYHTYFQIYNSYGGGLDPRTLFEYCQLRTLTGDSLNNSAGGYFKPACETIIREKQTGLRDCRVNGTLYSGCDQNPQVAVGTNWNGVGNMSGVVVKSDGTTFIQDYFNLLKSKLQTNGFLHNFVGIIPGYIIVFLLGIILFRFISH